MITKQTVYIFGEKLEVELELNLQVVDESFNYSYGSIESKEVAYSAELIEWDVISIKMTDNAALNVTYESSMKGEIEAAIAELDLEKILEENKNLF
jgi:hypothetical protein